MNKESEIIVNEGEASDNSSTSSEYLVMGQPYDKKRVSENVVKYNPKSLTKSLESDPQPRYGSFSPQHLHETLTYPLSFLPTFSTTRNRWGSLAYPNLKDSKFEEKYELENRSESEVPGAIPMRTRSFSASTSPKSLMHFGHYPLSPPSTSITSTTSEARTRKANMSLSASSDLSFSVPKRFYETFMITILKINHNAELNQPYVRVTFGDKVFQTSAAKTCCGNWNEGFEFQVSYHYQLFGTCQLDLYETNWLLPDSHRGRAEIRIASLEGFPKKFKSYYELYNKKYSASTISELARRTNHDQNLGAIQVKIQYRYMKQSDWDDSDFLIDSSIPFSSEPLSITNPEKVELNKEDFISTESTIPVFCEKLHKIEDDLSPTDSTSRSITKKRPSLLSPDRGGYFEHMEEEEDDSMFKFVGSYILSKSTRTVLRGVTRVYLAFFQGMELRHVEFFSGILLLEKFYSHLEKERIKARVLEQEDLALTNLSIVSEACYLHRFALAVYGWRGLVFCGKIPALAPTQGFSDHAALKKYLELDDEHLLAYEFHSNQVFQPTYFVAFDEKTNSIILSIRGTMSILDTMTDLVCDYLPWRGGLVHSGILSMAQSLMQHVIPGLMSHAVKFKVNRIFIVGHSLGGGAASILTMLFLDHLHEFRLPVPHFDIKCYSYGPPPSVSFNLAENLRYRPYIHTIINENDLIPHLSYGAMIDFKAMVLAATEIVNENHGSFLSFERLASAFQSSEAAAETREIQFKALAQARDHHMEVQHLNPKLYLPGKIHHIRSSNNLPEPFSYAKTATSVYENLELSSDSIKVTQDSSKSDSNQTTLCAVPVSSPLTQEYLRPPYYYMSTVPPEDFLETHVHASMLNDHLPTKYDKSLQNCMDLVKRLQKDTVSMIAK